MGLNIFQTNLYYAMICDNTNHLILHTMKPAMYTLTEFKS